jgi:acyl-CoA reductase-like NAD-dependent aldehyde dehydrogenase
MALVCIDGQSERVTSGRTYEVLNPATEETLDTAPEAASDDVDRAVAAARLAQPWAATSNLEKARYFHHFAEWLRDSQRELGELLSEEGGKCRRLAGRAVPPAPHR